jgi:hypothetical protein
MSMPSSPVSTIDSSSDEFKFTVATPFCWPSAAVEDSYMQPIQQSTMVSINGTNGNSTMVRRKKMHSFGSPILAFHLMTVSIDLLVT